QVTKEKAEALDAELKRFTAAWNKLEAMIDRHKATGILPAEFAQAQNEVGTAEVRLRVIQALAEQAADGASFGPVMERLVPANNESPWPWFDVDAGKAIVSLRGEDNDDADFLAQMQPGLRGLSTAHDTSF